MSEYGFGYYGNDDGTEGGEEQPPHLSETPPENAGPKWFREYMEKSSKQMKALTDELEERRAKDRRQTIAETLESKGYARSAAALYDGDPAKVDEWLNRFGDALARKEDLEGSPGPAGDQGPPQSSVPPTGQDQMQRMQAASMGDPGPLQGKDKELAAALAAAATPEEFQKIAHANGWNYNASGLYGA